MNRIKYLRENLNMTQNELAQKLGGSPSSIAMYEKGLRKPSLDVLVKLSEIFGCSVDYILNNTDEEKSKEEKIFYLIPLVGKISAGKPVFANENIEEYFKVDPVLFGLENQQDYFLLKVDGESMNLKVRNGDMVLIHKQCYANDGDIVVALVNGDLEATLKLYHRKNDETVELSPMSSLDKFKPIYPKITELKILGKAINYFGKF